jgi:hypothetical protein
VTARAPAAPAKWRGPAEPGEFPTLGWLVLDWIEANLIVPDGPRRGAPLTLTNEQCRFLLHYYRLRPRGRPHALYPRPREGRVHYGGQLRRPQKWGKDPLAAAIDIAAALGPVQWDGWDAYGEPVGRPVDTPWVQIIAPSDDATDNTWKPLYRMLSEGPLADTPGLDIGETRVKLPNGDGWLEPVPSSFRSRLGAPISHASITEPHLMRKADGGVELCKGVKRNLTGMGGTWMEATNAWDPSEQSVAQQTAEARQPGIYLDHAHADLPNLTVAEFDDDRIVLERIIIKYGDSCRKNGGWVDERSILADVRDPAVGVAEARRYYLDEVTVGERDAVDATRWAALARPGEVLERGTAVTLGFDGSRYRDATVLTACRIADGRWFPIGVWTPAEHGGKVPEPLVEQALDDAHDAYDVWFLIADPYRWQTVLDRKAGQWGKHPRSGQHVVIDFPTNVESKMDAAIDLWNTAFRTGEGEFTHDGNATVTEHALNASIAFGKRKPPREDGEALVSDRYQKVVKKRGGRLIDAFVAGILATYGRGLAIEHGAAAVSAEPWVMFT